MTATATTTATTNQQGGDATNSSNSKANAGDWSIDLSRVTLLVQFLEYLEKNIYNAYEGTAISIPQPTLKVKKK